MADEALTVSRETLESMTQRLDELLTLRARMRQNLSALEEQIQQQQGAIGLMQVLLGPAAAGETPAGPAPVEQPRRVRRRRRR